MEDILIRECRTIDELDDCVRLQSEVFGLPDLEISPRRHLIVSKQAGGFTLGAFLGGRLVGFVHHLVAVRGDDEIIGYSHMMAVARDHQNKGVGAQLKWAQRKQALAQGRDFIKWTWDPMQARNAYFNLNRLGVTVRHYAQNFYGTDYATDPAQQNERGRGIDSDRLFAHWELNSPRVLQLALGAGSAAPLKVIGGIEIPADWAELLQQDVETARKEQLRVRSEFKEAFARGLVCTGFERALARPRYLLSANEDLKSL